MRIFEWKGTVSESSVNQRKRSTKEQSSRDHWTQSEGLATSCYLLKGVLRSSGFDDLLTLSALLMENESNKEKEAIFYWATQHA